EAPEPAGIPRLVDDGRTRGQACVHDLVETARAQESNERQGTPTLPFHSSLLFGIRRGAVFTGVGRTLPRACATVQPSAVLRQRPRRAQLTKSVTDNERDEQAA